MNRVDSAMDVLGALGLAMGVFVPTFLWYVGVL